MSLPLPNLDDRTFDDLVAEGLRRIPGLAPAWTDHNPSDPGITLLELFAFVAESLIYRADQVTDANRVAFVRLLRGDPSWVPTRAMSDEVRDAVLWVRAEQRAVTADDFRRLAEAAGPAVSGGKPVARAHALPGYHIEVHGRRYEAPSHVSVLILAAGDGAAVAPDAALIAHVRAELAPRCLLTTRLHVAGPLYLAVRVRLHVWIFAEQDEAAVRARIERRLTDYLHPLRGGTDGAGWPFGATLYVSDLYALLDGVEGVDYVVPQDGEPVVLTVDRNDRDVRDGASVIGVRLFPDELIELTSFARENPAARDSWIAISRHVSTPPAE